MTDSAAPAGNGHAAGTGTPPAIELIGIEKRFGAVQANRDIHLRV